MNPVTKKKVTKKEVGSTSCCSDTPSMIMAMEHSNEDKATSLAGVLRQRTARMMFLVKINMKKIVPSDPTSSSISNKALCA